MGISSLAAVFWLAVLEGALVALPRGDALKSLGRLRSPAWAALLPGSILVGTFGPLLVASMGIGLAILATIATPLLAAVAVVAVARGPRAALVPLGLVLAAAAGLAGGSISQLSASILTALGCMALGVAMVRLIPQRWVLIGALGMCVLDVAFLATGIGLPAAAVIAHATADIHGPAFDQARAGNVSTDYPDLVLAGVLGGSVAGARVQRAAGLLLIALAAPYGLLLGLSSALPATVPIVITFGLVKWRAPLARSGRTAASRALILGKSGLLLAHSSPSPATRGRPPRRRPPAGTTPPVRRGGGEASCELCGRGAGLCPRHAAAAAS